MPMLKRFAMKLCFDTVRAEDLVQETVMRALEHRADFAPGTNLNAWLTVILRNWYYSDIRKRRREVEDPDDIMANQLLSGDNVIRKIEAREALAMVDMLPENFKKPLLLIADARPWRKWPSRFESTSAPSKAALTVAEACSAAKDSTMVKAPIRVWREPVDNRVVAAVAFIEFVTYGQYHATSAFVMLRADDRYWKSKGEKALRDHITNNCYGHVPYVRSARG
jgi:RNA polymerase sigma factor (sigma-70 family)